jgi:RNA binding exosome subunit
VKKANILLVIIVVQIFSAHLCYAGFLDNVMKMFGGSSQEKPDENTITSALKEAIVIGANNAVKSVSKNDGYFGNQAIKILIPEKIKMIAEGLGKIGYQKQVDDFILSMNRAAEKAAPKAKSFFIDAIKEMTFDDARKILNGDDTAASDYFKIKTNDKLYEAFKPIISSSMNEAGVTRYYKDMTSKFTSLPFVKPELLDLDHYVTNNALDGLFYMIGEEEKKIRTDPAARVTELLKKVFEK